jgi:hypothetical protein
MAAQTRLILICALLAPCLAMAIIFTIKPLYLLLILCGLGLLLISLNNLDYLVYLFLLTLPFASQLLKEKESALVIWGQMALILTIWGIKKVLSSQVIHTPPRLINVFFILFGALIFLSDIYHLDILKFVDNIRIGMYCLSFYVFYDWMYDKKPMMIIVSLITPYFIILLWLVVVILKNPSVGNILKMTVLRYSVFFINPNILGSYICIIIPLIFSIWAKKYFKKYSPVFLLIILLAILNLIISNSRAAYLGLGASLTVMIFQKKVLRPFIIIMITVFVSIYHFSYMPHQIIKFILRTEGDATSGRSVVWNSSLNALKNDLIFGSSIGNESINLFNNLPMAKFKHEYGEKVESHNLYLNKSIEVGVFAIPLFLYLFIALGIIVFKNSKYNITAEENMLNFASMGIIITLFVRSFFEHSVLISGGGIFPEFLSWIILAWPMIIYQKYRSNLSPQ